MLIPLKTRIAALISLTSSSPNQDVGLLLRRSFAVGFHQILFKTVKMTQKFLNHMMAAVRQTFYSNTLNFLPPPVMYHILH